MKNINELKEIISTMKSAKIRGTYDVTIFKEAMNYDGETSSFLMAADSLTSEDLELILKHLDNRINT